jgi:hypothetical protein
MLRSLDAVVEAKQLTDLHTHLLGMGDAKFWIGSITERVKIAVGTPTDQLASIKMFATATEAKELNLPMISYESLNVAQLDAKYVAQIYKDLTASSPRLHPASYDHVVKKLLELRQKGVLPAEHHKAIFGCFTADFVFTDKDLAIAFDLRNEEAARNFVIKLGKPEFNFQPEFYGCDAVVS